jgi:hypothetical protein
MGDAAITRATIMPEPEQVREEEPAASAPPRTLREKHGPRRLRNLTGELIDKFGWLRFLVERRMLSRRRFSRAMPIGVGFHAARTSVLRSETGWNRLCDRQS